MVKILFLCLGNICRSPLAEALFAEKLRKSGLDSKIFIDSAGTGNWHVGENPDRRTIEVADKNSIPINHRAQQLIVEHFHEFDYIITMDQQNYADADSIKPDGAKAQLILMREFDDAADMDVPDPYFGGSQGFDNVFAILDEALNGLLEYLKDKHAL